MIAAVRWLLLSLLAVSTLWPAWAGAPAPAAAMAAAPALWEVTAPGKPGRLVLLGTIHLLPADIAWQQAPGVRAAVAGADRLVLEMTPEEMASPALQQEAARLGLAPEGERLSQIVPPPLLARVNQAMAGAGMPAAAADSLRPWMLSLMLAVNAAQKAGLDPALGVDQQLGGQFNALRKPVIGLETGAEQIRFFAGMSRPVAITMLRETLDELERAPGFFRDLAQAWARGDTALLEQRFLDSLKSTPEAYDVLIRRRNQAWLPALRGQLAQPGTTLVAVGAAHVIGPDGLAALLASDGYQVTRLP